MSVMGDSTSSELINMLSLMLKLLMSIEQHHSERVIRGKSITHNIGKAGLSAATFVGRKASDEIKKRIMGGEIDLKKFNKLQKKMDFSNVKVSTAKLPEIMDSAKKAGVPVLFSCENGNNISVIAVPTEHQVTIQKIMEMMISKEVSRDKNYEININSDFKSGNDLIFHNILDSYDIPTVTFQKSDGTEVIAVPSEFQSQYLDACAEAKETVRNIEKIEIADFTNDGFVWDDPATTAIEVTPIQAKFLAEYNAKVSIAEVDGKLYAYGKDIEQDVADVIKDDYTAEKKTDEWQIGIIDNTVTFNKEKLLGLDEGATQLIKLPGEQDHYIRFDKSELGEKDHGKTITSKLDYEKEYEICDSEGNTIENRLGKDLASSFSTRSPFEKLLNETTDKSEYDKFIDRIELLNVKTNKIVSIPIDDYTNIQKSLIAKMGMDDRTAEKMAYKISQKMSPEYNTKFGFEQVFKKDYSVGKVTQNAVKAAALSQKLKDFKCKNSDKVQGDVFIIYDKRTQEYVFVERNKWYQADNMLKEMGYNSIERSAVVSALKQKYDINGEIENSINYGQTITASSPSLENVRFSDLGNGVTSIFNVENDKIRYVTIDKDVSALEFEQLCKEKLGITNDSALAEMAEKFKDKIKAPEMVVDKVDGIKYSITQLTSKYIQISDGNKSAVINKNVLNTEKIAQQLNISEKSAEKISTRIKAAFKANDGMKKGIMPLNQLKATAEKVYNKSKETTVDEKGQVKSQKLQTTERSL